MDSVRDYFLSRSGFAQQQSRPSAFPELLDQPQDLARAGRLAH